MISRAVQTSMPLRDPRWLRPLLGVNGAMSELGLNAEEVDEQIDLGGVIAFNIAVALSGKREVRFLRASLVNCRARLEKPKATLVHFTWPEILRLVLPHYKPFLNGTELDAALNCDPDHRLNLLRARELSALRTPHSALGWRPGRNGAPSITRESVEQFLKRRQL
jgi:hypothetical protein